MVLEEMFVAEESQDLITFTAEIVSSHVSNNSVPTAEVAGLIQAVHAALAKLGEPEPAAEPEKPKGAIGIRASIKPDFIVSMIDGKPYKMLRRHISQHGYTPESYRETFGLPKDYPLVAASYAEQRRSLAHKIGLGRKAREAAAEGPVAAAEPIATEAPAKPGRRRKTKTDA